MKSKALISCTVTAKLICTFVFTYTKSRFSHYVAQMTFLFSLCNRKLKKPLQPKLTIQIATPGSKAETPKPVPILAAYICDEDDKNLILMHGNYLKPTFEKVVSTITTNYRKIPRFSETKKCCCHLPKIQTKTPNLWEFH